MAIICPPSSAPTPPNDFDGWTISKNNFGTYARARRPRTYSGLHQWSKPSALLNGQSLYQYNKAYLAWAAHYWKTGTPQALGYTNAHGATNPFTNITGSKTAHNGFQLFMHCAMTSRFAGRFPNWGWRYFGFNWGGQAFQQAIQETDQTTPAIVGATLKTDWTYTIDLSNWDSGTEYIGGAAIYVTTPGNAHYSGRTLHIIDVCPPSGDFNHWTDGGRGIPAQLMKPYPAGSEVLIGIRGCSPFYDCGILPTPLAAVNVTVGAA